MNDKNNNETRDVPTTILTIDRETIDWDLLKRQCYIVRYEMPRPNYKDWYYYPRMHNWYKQTSEFPCYLHTHGPFLYINYEHRDKVLPLSYEGRDLLYEEVDIHNKDRLPPILKLLLANFFQADGRFVSNAHFFLWAQAHKEFVTGLKIKLSSNWQENDNEFVISDQAARLRKLRSLDSENISDWKRKNRIYYGRFYAEGMPIFKQLKPDQLTSKQIKEGVYELYEGSTTNRATLPFHSVKSLKSLQQTRSYLLNQFISKFVIYLNNLGLPFQQKQLQMKPMHTTTPAFMQKRQLPLEQKPIYVVDDRLNTYHHSAEFVTQFCNIANNDTDYHDALFVEKTKADLQPGDWVLRLQDYEKNDFNPKTGILKDLQDPKADFYSRHPDVVKQSINVNNNKLQTEVQQNHARTWSADDYLNYSFPKINDIKTQLDVCRNQLFLKDIILFPKNVCQRLPQIEMMKGMVFLYERALIFFDGKDLHFASIVNNIDSAISFIQEHTGWDLMNDVLFPSAKERKNTAGIPNQEEIAEATKRPFIISRDFVWEIGNANGRPLHEDLILKERLEILEQVITTKRFYPPKPIQENNHFTVAQLQAYAEFLDQHVQESTISYLDLKSRYGKHIKDQRGIRIESTKGFFPLLGIQNDSKFKHYLSECLGLAFESIREDKLFPVYKGIWYAPETNHYVVGVKDSNTGEQERGHVLRRIIVHRGMQNPAQLQTQLSQSFFPMLEVNFIKHRNYTVMPFPFRLITMWQKEVENPMEML